jgi:hypothetical protein
MATVTVTRGTTLPDSSGKADFHALVDSATATVTNIVNADIDAAAAIADSKLAAITTAGKVSGAALTLLPNTPSGAGELPIANVPSKTLLRKVVSLKVTADADLLVAGDGAMYFTCPTELNGMNLVGVGASTIVAGTGVTVQLARGRRSAANGACTYADMLSTRITIDTGEYDSANAAASAVIDTSNDDIVVSTYVDILRVDVDVASGSGLEVRLSFQTP